MDSTQIDSIAIPTATEMQRHEYYSRQRLPERDRPPMHKYLTPEQWMAIPDSIFGMELEFDEKYQMVVGFLRLDYTRVEAGRVPPGTIELYVSREGLLVRNEFDSVDEFIVPRSEVVVKSMETKQVMIIPLPENYIVTPGNLHLHMDDPRLNLTLDSVPDAIDGHSLSVVEKVELIEDEVVLGGERYRVDSERFLVKGTTVSGGRGKDPVTYDRVSYEMPEIGMDDSVVVIPLTERQQESLRQYSDGFESAGMYAGFPEIYQIQLLSVPDQVGKTNLWPSDKVELLAGKLTGATEFNRFGESYYLNDRHQISRISLNRDTTTRKELVTRKEVSFNYLSIKNSVIMNEQNVNYLKLQLKYLGFGDALNGALEAAIKNPEIRDFSLKAQAEKPTKMGNMSQFEMYFNKNENSENYYFPRYRADLLDKDGNISRSNYFGVYQTKSIKAMESVNLLEGRSVKTTRDTGTESSVVYAKLDFNNKTQHGNFKTEYFNEKNYGIDVMAILDKSHMIFENEEAKQKTAKALEKGNLVEGHFWLNGNKEEGLLALNAQYKNLDYFHQDARPVYSKLLGEHTREVEFNNGVGTSPEDELGMRNVEIVSATEGEQLLDAEREIDGDRDQSPVHISELTAKQHDKAMYYFEEGVGNLPTLSQKQLASVPDSIDGNILTVEMKQQLLFGVEVQVTNDLKYQVAADNTIDRTFQKEELSQVSKVFSGDVSFSNAKANDLKPWESGNDEEISEKTGISR